MILKKLLYVLGRFIFHYCANSDRVGPFWRVRTRNLPNNQPARAQSSVIHGTSYMSSWIVLPLRCCLKGSSLVIHALSAHSLAQTFFTLLEE